MKPKNLSELEELSKILSKDSTYIRDHCTIIGIGTARIVYRAGNYVIKVPRNKIGTKQNKAEVRVWSEQYSTGIVTNIYWYASDYSWMLCERASPTRKTTPEFLSKVEAFKTKAGLAEADEFGTVSGKLRLIDYGCTIDIARKHYPNWDDEKKIFTKKTPVPSI